MKRWYLIGGLCLALGACAQTIYEDPIAVMVDRQVGLAQRKAAFEQAKQRFATDPRRIAALHDLVWQRGYATWQRIDAIDELLRIDQRDFRDKLAGRILLIQNLNVSKYLFKLAIERKWHDFTPVVVRHYARPIFGLTESQRPEPDVIAALNPGKTVEQVVFDVFTRIDPNADVRQQHAAWELLARISDTDSLIAALDKAPATTPLVIDLKAAAAQLHVLPKTREQLLWLQHLRDPAMREFWARAVIATNKLDTSQRRSLELRHLPILMRVDSSVYAMSRDQLESRVRQTIASHNHYMISPTVGGGPNDSPQGFHSFASKLTWVDLVTIDLFTSLMRDRSLTTQLFNQADHDYADPTTEHGGVLDFVNNQYIAIAFSPMYRGNNLKFVPPQKMIRRMYTGLAHYHFHVQSYKNEHYAGAGLGDLKLIDRMRFNGLVFTFINRDLLNVDYYQSGRIVIDLGTIRR